MKHFIANVIAMFFVSRHKRHMARRKVMDWMNLPITVSDLQTQITDLHTQIINLQKMFEELNHTEPEQSNQETTIKEQEYLKIKSQWLQHNNGKQLLPGRSTEYDLIFAIGSTCFITDFLNMFNLRRFSTPFEWTGGMVPEKWNRLPGVYRDTRFREKIDAICNDFSEYMIPEDFQYVSEWTGNKEHHNVVNTRTHIRFVHHFPINKSIEEYMSTFVETMQRRAERLQDAFTKSNKILICWLSTLWEQRAILEKSVLDKDIKYAIKCLNKKFPNKQIDFVFFEHDGRMGRFEFERKEIAPGAVRIKSNHFLYDDEYDFKGEFDKNADKHHLHVVSECLDNIKLSETAYYVDNNE